MIERFETPQQRAIFLGVSVFFVACVAVALVSVAERVGRPSPGFAVWSNLVVPALSPESGAAASAIPFRSIVRAMDGQRIRVAAELRERLEASPIGTLHHYRFRRSGHQREATLPSRVLHWGDVLPVFLPYLLVGSSFFVMVLVVFWFAPAHPAARATLFAGGALGATLILAIDTVSAGWLERPYFVLESLVPGAFLHFSLCFPERKEVLRRRPSLAWLVYLPFLPLGVLENVVLRRFPERHLVLNDLVYVAIAVTGLVMVGSLLHTYVTSRSSLARQRVKVVTAGLALAAFVPSLGLLSVILFGVPLPINLLSPLFMFFPLTVAYAIARHDLFQVDRYVRTGVVYAALSLLVFIGYAGVVLGTERIVGGDRLPAGLVPLFLVLVLVVFQPLRSRIQSLVDRLFARQSYSYRGTVERTSRALASMLESERIATTLLHTVTEGMAIEWGVLFVFGEAAAERLVYGSSTAQAVRAAGVFAPGGLELAQLAAQRRVVSVYEDGDGRRSSASEAVASMRALGAVLSVPVCFEGKTSGILLLGEKRSGAFFSDDDLALLQTLVNQTAVALENARAYELLRRTRDELVQAERLAAVGQLSAAVAHGIRNPLAGIRAAAQVAREDLGSGDSGADTPGGGTAALAETLDDILSETDRLETRVRTVLDLARPFEAHPVRGDLNDLVRCFAAGLRSRIPAGIELEVALDEGLPAVRFDAGHLTEALDVLATNALQAMQDHGRLRIRTGRAAARAGSERGTSVALVEVADTGPGMNSTQLRHAFDLFYTTKTGGTGIGLPVAKRFVEAQGGALEASSTPGEGATFTIHLPLAEPGRDRDGDPKLKGECSGEPSPEDSRRSPTASGRGRAQPGG